MKISELNEIQKPELEIKLQDNLDALQNLRFQKALQQLSDPQQIRYLRREIAQIKTVLREYELGIRKDLAEDKK
jgi:large subunit ribosomal protein L29